MSNEKYLSVYLGTERKELIEAYDRLAKKNKLSRNRMIESVLWHFVWLAGELKK